MGSLIDDPRHWRTRAEQMRELSKAATDLDAKATMLRLADDYERLAGRAAQRADVQSGRTVAREGEATAATTGRRWGTPL